MLTLIYPALLWLGLEHGTAWLWLPLLLNIVLVPALDHLLGRWRADWRRPDSWLRWYFSPPVFWLYAIAQLAALLLALKAVGTRHLGAGEFFALASAAGIMTGTAGITAAHELIHRRGRAQRALGLGLLAMVSYMHFRIEHAYGHHRHVGTAEDPATARFGEGFPAFFMRSLVGGLRGAWRIECQRLHRRGESAGSPRNRMLHYLGIQTVIFLALFGFGGWVLAVWFLLQSFIAVHLLEAVNYVQHYGLLRERIGNGYEPLGPQHAWDADDAISGLLVFNLSRHAGHHLHVEQRCEDLRALPLAPRLPCSFFLMVFIALSPPLWRRLMDARVPRCAPQALQSRSLPDTGGVIA